MKIIRAGCSESDGVVSRLKIDLKVCGGDYAVARRIAVQTSGNGDRGRASGAWGGRKQRRKHLGIGGGRKCREAAATGGDVAGVEARGNLREREQDGGGLPSLERPLIATDRKGWREGVEADRRTVATGAGVTCRIGIRAARNCDRGRAAAALSGREGGGVNLGIAANRKAAEAAAAGGDVGSAETAGNFREGEADRGSFAGFQSAGAAADRKGWREGVEADRHTAATGAGVTCRIGIRAARNCDRGRAAAALSGREGGGVNLGIAANRKAAEAAAAGGDVGSAETAGNFREGEADRGSFAGFQSAGAAADRKGWRQGAIDD